MTRETATTETKPQIQYAPTGFVEDTELVVDMAQKVRDRAGAIFWYEDAQGGLDNNNWSLGRPSIVCINKKGVEQDYFEYFGQARQSPLDRVEVRNWIRVNEGGEAQGLSPAHLFQMAHRGGDWTLGVHGTGLTAASLLASTGEFAKGISYASKDRKGVWKGRGRLMRRPDQDEGDQPELIIEYQRFPYEDANQTVITIHEPTELLMEGLDWLPQVFLPANPLYQYSQFKGTENQAKTANLYTKFVARPGQVPEGAATFTPEELTQMGFDLDQITSPTQLPRIEILPDSLVPENLRGHTIFTDGLCVNTDYRFVHNWAVYGFGRLRSPFRIARSHHSWKLDGTTSAVIGLFLTSCDSADIFLPILKSAMTYPHTIEASLSPETLSRMTEPAQAALKEAWEALKAELGLGDREVLVTTNPSLKKTIEAENGPVVLIQSEGFAKAICQYAGVKAAEDVVGIKKVASETGESTIQVVYKKPDEQLKIGMDALIDETALRRGRIEIDKTTETIRVRLPETILDYFNGEFAEIPYGVSSFARNLSAVLGHGTRCEIEVEKGDQLITFELDPLSLSSGEIRKVVLYIKKGEKVATGQPGTRLMVTPSWDTYRNYDTGIPIDQAKSVYVGMIQNLEDELRGITDETGSIDWAKYKERGNAETAILARRLQAQKNELRRLRLAAQETLTALTGEVAIVASDRPQAQGIRIEDPTSRRLMSRNAGLLSTRLHDNLLGYKDPRMHTMRHSMEVAFRRRFNPDLKVVGSYKGGYLIEGLDRAYSSADFDEFEQRDDIVFGQRTRLETVVINRQLGPGERPMYNLIGYRPVGYYHPTHPRIAFFELPGKNMWRIYSDTNLPGGLKIYYEKIDFKDSSLPGAVEKKPLANFEELSEPWKDLITEALNDNDLSDMQKLCIIQLACYHSFTYNAKFIRPYAEGDLDFAKRINVAKGTCADAARRPIAALRMLGIPTRGVIAMALEGSGALSDENEHTLYQAFVDEEWRTLEPQANPFVAFVDRRQKIPKIPEKYWKLIDKIQAREFNLGKAVLDTAIVGGVLASGGVALLTAAELLTRLPMLRVPVEGVATPVAQIARETPNFPSLPPIHPTPENLIMLALAGALPATYILAQRRMARYTDKTIDKAVAQQMGKIEEEAKEKARQGFIKQLQDSIERIKLEEGEQKDE